MKKLHTYFLSESYSEFRTIEEAVKVGSAFTGSYEENAIDIFSSLEDAKKELQDYQTEIREFSNNGIKRVSVHEYAIIERVYDIDDVLKNEDIASP